MEWTHIPQLASLAAVDSVNILAFAVIAGLWLSMRDRPEGFAPRAAQFTGGAFCGILTLAALSVWVIGSNQDRFRALWENPIAAIVAGVIGLVLVVLGIRQHPASTPETTDNAAPVPQTVMQRIGLAGTGFALGIIQSGTSVPFAGGVVLISFADTAIWQQIIEILVFAIVAITPSALLITVLSRVRGDRVGRATIAVNRFMRRAKALGRGLTIVVGVALVALAAVRLVQLDVIL